MKARTANPASVAAMVFGVYLSDQFLLAEIDRNIINENQFP